MNDIDKRPQRFGWAPGGYYCACSKCGEQFVGDKRAIHCAPLPQDMAEWLSERTAMREEQGARTRELLKKLHPFKK